MSDEVASDIKARLDGKLSPENFEYHHQGPEAGAIEFFQEIFVDLLNFELTTDPFGDAPGEELSTDDWNDRAGVSDAYIIAEAADFRVTYVTVDNLTRTAERYAISSMQSGGAAHRRGWIREGEFLAIFHEPGSDIWHLVSPYSEEDESDGRTTLRRYILGEGETHRTVSSNLAEMDAAKEGLLRQRIDQAFQLKPVTEHFYDDYKRYFNDLDQHLREKGLELEESKKYAHLTLNRMMFIYFLQKKGWLSEEKEFMKWFLGEYDGSDDEGVFHEKWLNALFFEGMSTPDGTQPDADLTDDAEDAITNIPYMNGGLFEPDEIDKRGVYIDDSLLREVITKFLEEYNFTVTEESPYDLDVAVDPAMLGKIYESLIAEEERGEAGIFYTPRVEVDLMCRLAVYEQLSEQVGDLDDDGRELIIDFVFSELQEWEEREVHSTDRLEKILHNLKAVDPACGSGAFLVGMKQVLTELYRKLGVLSPESDANSYELKEQIINENLYGVDIKDWAVRVAEFRLWLSLVEGEDTLPDQQPVLPNFSFKLKVGDSIVQKVDDEFVSLDSLSRSPSEAVQRNLDELSSLKTRYFDGETELADEIEKTQQELLKSHIDAVIDDLEGESPQATLTGDITEESKEKQEEVQARIERLEETKEAIDKVGNDGLFLWDLEFPEVMLEGGFDIAIGNPPYVRNENIVNQGLDPERLEELSEDEVEELKDQYSRDLEAYIERNFDIDAGGQTDLYLYFFFKSVEILQTNGTLSFITSNSWLDTEFGAAIQELLLTEATPEYILDNVAERSFEEADINTVITIADKKQSEHLGEDANFVSVNTPFNSLTQKSYEDLLLEEGATSNIQLQDETGDVKLADDLRRITITTDALWRLGGGETAQIEANDDDSPSVVYSERTGITSNQSGIDSFSSDETSDIYLPEGDYDGEKWGQFIHAPDAFFEVLRAGADQFQLLDDLGDVDSGINTRANRFFYLYEVPKEKWEEVDIENFQGTDFPDDCQVVRSEIGTWKARGCEPPIEDTYWLIEDEYLRTVIQSPQQSMSIRFDVDELETLILSIYKDWPELDGTYVRDYLEYAKSSKKVTRKSNGEEVEALKVNQRPELSKRKQRMDDGSNAVWWYEVLDKNYSRILLPKSCGYSFRTMLSTELVPVDNNLYCFVFDDDPTEKELIGLTLYLNSTIVALLRELYGRSNLGQGGLKTEGVDWSRIPCPDTETLVEIADEYDNREALFERKIEKIWDEVEKEDKQQLDEIVFEKIGTSPELAEELQERTVELVRRRKKRAESA